LAELDGYQAVCNGAEVSNGGKGYCFTLSWEGGHVPAFIIRYRDEVHGFLNRCAHQAIELDWNPGEFFDKDRSFILCATHGAIYDPESGACTSGRCNGRGLTPIDVIEVDEIVYVRSNEAIQKHD